MCGECAGGRGGTAAAVLSAGTAQAAKDASVKVCNDAATQCYFSLDQAPRNGFASYIVNADECRTFNYGVHPGE